MWRSRLRLRLAFVPPIPPRNAQYWLACNSAAECSGLNDCWSESSWGTQRRRIQSPFHNPWLTKSPDEKRTHGRAVPSRSSVPVCTPGHLSTSFGNSVQTSGVNTSMNAYLNSCLISLIILVPLLSTSVAQSGSGSAGQNKYPHLTADEKIRGAVFRYLIARDSSRSDKHDVYCLSVSRGDPSGDLMQSFESSKPPVRKRSECSADSFKGVTEKTTGKHGIIFNADEIRWISLALVEVSGGYYHDGLSASGNTYRLVKSKGTWKVVRDKLNWVSWHQSRWRTSPRLNADCWLLNADPHLP